MSALPRSYSLLELMDLPAGPLPPRFCLSEDVAQLKRENAEYRAEADKWRRAYVSTSSKRERELEAENAALRQSNERQIAALKLYVFAGKDGGGLEAFLAGRAAIEKAEAALAFPERVPKDPQR